MAEIHISHRNNKKLACSGYIYNRERVRCGTTYWTCHQRTCIGRATSTHKDGKLEVKITRRHNHPFQHDEITLMRMRTRLKRKAREQLEVSPSDMVQQELDCLPPSITLGVHEVELLCRVVARSRESRRPKEVVSAADIKISESFFQTISGQQFLLHDNIILNEVDQITQRTIIFATDDNIVHLFASNVWYADATFHIAPTMFCQLWTIHGRVKESVFPLVYVLMQTKKEEEYLEILVRLQQRALELNIFYQGPSVIMVDFNKGAVNAIRIVFPQAKLGMCLYHYKHSLWRKIQDFCLQGEHSRVGSLVKKWLWCAIGLAYVPPEDVDEAFELFLKDLETTDSKCEERIKNFGEHLGRNYVRGQPTKDNRWMPPRYPIRLWNTYKRTLTDELMIDRAIEEWEWKFCKTIHSCKYSIDSVVGAIRGEQNYTESILINASTGNSVQMLSEGMLQTNEKLQQLVMRYQEYKSSGKILEYCETAGSYNAVPTQGYL